MAHNIKQHNLIGKYKSEFLLKDKNKKVIDEAKGSLSDCIEMEAGLKGRNHEKIDEANKIVKKFAVQTWNKDFEIQKNFKSLEYWEDSLMGEFQIPYKNT